MPPETGGVYKRLAGYEIDIRATRPVNGWVGDGLTAGAGLRPNTTACAERHADKTRLADRQKVIQNGNTR